MSVTGWLIGKPYGNLLCNWHQFSQVHHGLSEPRAAEAWFQRSTVKDVFHKQLGDSLLLLGVWIITYRMTSNPPRTVENRHKKKTRKKSCRLRVMRMGRCDKDAHMSLKAYTDAQPQCWNTKLWHLQITFQSQIWLCCLRISLDWAFFSSCFTNRCIKQSSDSFKSLY